MTTEIATAVAGRAIESSATGAAHIVVVSSTRRIIEAIIGARYRNKEQGQINDKENAKKNQPHTTSHRLLLDRALFKGCDKKRKEKRFLVRVEV